MLKTQLLAAQIKHNSTVWFAGRLDGHEARRAILDGPDRPFVTTELESGIPGLGPDREDIFGIEVGDPELGTRQVRLEPDVSLISASIIEEQRPQSVSLGQPLASFYKRIRTENGPRTRDGKFGVLEHPLIDAAGLAQ